MNARILGYACTALLTACAGVSPQPVEFRGETLANKAGMTLYTFDQDVGGKSSCVDACAKLWPPLLAMAEDKSGFDFTVITRPDGSRQWAYGDKPLYLFSKDTKPGDMAGDNFNNAWHRVARPAPKDPMY